ncbi:carbohydrate kinase [Planotetraspora thailandica]|uniref:Carbohydrate kinase n=1 Tax=Planotetraspora thailandica TaxID=487172 RepID=A0A8J3XV06_9ACTN|nr:rhamnulokinase family protein [Planotetraspora thailandica]GII56017.1 carbohydrate kinase [Planotetraspora thailandica]
MTATIAAIDLGASSGRVITARVGEERLEITDIYRFPNRSVRLSGTLHWDILGLYHDVLEGLHRIDARHLDSVGIDSWAVDYGLLDREGRLIGNPVHYRDDRTTAVIDRVHDRVGSRRLYEINGLQFLPFNTLYQLAAEPFLGQAGTLLLIPDLISYWLTGQRGAEQTNASTTGLYDVCRGTWSDEIIDALSLPPGIFPGLRSPGEPAGRILPAAGAFPGTPVTTVASHDTASAIAAIPAVDRNVAYISCGTWSLAGVESSAPILTEEGRAANFTNETGVDGTIRYLRNIMGLWLLSESLRTWGVAPVELGSLLDRAAEIPALRSVIDPNDPVFMPPGDIPARVAHYCAVTGQPVPETKPEVVRCVIDSLALGHRIAIEQALTLSGQRADVVHIVGGGAQNALLCQLTADAIGLPVIAGPVEATALGNIGIQARSLGLISSLTSLRSLIAETQPLRTYEPIESSAGWANAANRLRASTSASA